jgi:hypothetical protein
VRFKPLLRSTIFVALTACGLAQADDERFDIRRYQVEGNFARARPGMRS